MTILMVLELNSISLLIRQTFTPVLIVNMIGIALVKMAADLKKKKEKKMAYHLLYQIKDNVIERLNTSTTSLCLTLRFLRSTHICRGKGWLELSVSY